MKREFLNALPLMLGPEIHYDPRDYMRRVIEFQYRFVPLISPENTSHTLNEESIYCKADILDRFQRTLTCSFETGQYLGKVVNRTFKKGWTLIDVGGAEGVFTKEVLAQCKTLPSTIWLVEPAQRNIQSYRLLMSQNFPGIKVEAAKGLIENVIMDLPEVDLVLASHSLYSVLDRDREQAEQLIRSLTQKATRGFCYISMASKDSPAYEIKRRILRLLNLPDISSFGENLRPLIPQDCHCTQGYRDSLIDITDILRSDEQMLAWLEYFCRVGASYLRPNLQYCYKVMMDNAIEFSRLPSPVRQRYSSTGLMKRLGLTPDSKVLLHKELLMQIYKKTVAGRGKI